MSPGDFVGKNPKELYQLQKKIHGWFSKAFPGDDVEIPRIFLDRIERVSKEISEENFRKHPGEIFRKNL